MLPIALKETRRSIRDYPSIGRVTFAGTGILSTKSERKSDRMIGRGEFCLWRVLPIDAVRVVACCSSAPENRSRVKYFVPLLNSNATRPGQGTSKVA